MGYFDELAKAIGADKEVTEKYPALLDALSRAEEISRQLETIKRDYQAAQAHLSRWEEWAERNWDETKNMTKAEAKLLEQVEQLRSQLASQSKESHMPDYQDQSYFNDVAEMLRREGYVRQAELEPLLSSRPTSEDVRRQIEDAVQRLAAFYTDLDSVSWSHFKEFGDALDKEKFLKFMTENKMTSVRDAYDRFVADAREKKRQAEVEAQIEKAKREAAEQARREAAMSAAKLPTDSKGSAVPTIGPLQRKFMESAKTAGPDVPLGKGLIAEAAYQEWLEKQGSTPE